MTVGPRFLAAFSKARFRARALPAVLAPLFALWALELSPLRFPGTTWVEGGLAALVVASSYRVIQSAFTDAVLGLRLTQDALAVTAAAIGFGASFLISALDAAARLPAGLADPRGGPVLLNASAAGILAVRVIVRRKPASRMTVRCIEPDRLPPQAAAGGAVPSIVWLGLGGSVALSLGLAIPMGAEGGLTGLAVIAMALLAATSLDAIRGSALDPPLDTVFVERSGVLTSGEPEVTGVFPLKDDLRPEDVLHLAAAAEYSTHDAIQRAILRGCDARFRTVPSIKEVHHVAARGIRAIYQEKEMLLGNVRLFRESGWSAERLALLEAKAEELSPDGETVLFLALGGELAGAVCLLDPLLPGAADALRRLVELGVSVRILSGDSPQSVRSLVREVDRVVVHAGLAPDEKSTLLEQWRREGRGFALLRNTAKEDRGKDAAGPSALEGVARIAAVLAVLSEHKARVGAQRFRAALTMAYHAVALPILSGALKPWIALPAVPAIAACAAALAPRLLSFVFTRTKTYNRPLHLEG